MKNYCVNGSRIAENIAVYVAAELMKISVKVDAELIKTPCKWRRD